MATASDHDIGDAVRLWCVFRDEVGVQAAPTTVTLTVRHPDGTVEDVETLEAIEADLTAAQAATGQTLEDEVGVYKAVVTPDIDGWWLYKWSGAGAVVEQEPGWFAVRRDRVGVVEEEEVPV